MINSHSATRGGSYRETSGFELDRLFGLALTDARFFRQLREHPYQAVSRFDLTETEARAVLRIAPSARSIQELALELDAWMTDNTPEAVPVVSREPAWANRSTLRRPGPLVPVGRERRPPHDTLPPYAQMLPVESQDGGQRICLQLSECLSQN
jgi:hypothetical protein